jgi:hypothetical protein
MNILGPLRSVDRLDILVHLKTHIIFARTRLGHAILSLGSNDHHRSLSQDVSSFLFTRVARGSSRSHCQTRGHLSQLCPGEKRKKRKSVRLELLKT